MSQVTDEVEKGPTMVVLVRSRRSSGTVMGGCHQHTSTPLEDKGSCECNYECCDSSRTGRTEVHCLPQQGMARTIGIAHKNLCGQVLGGGADGRQHNDSSKERHEVLHREQRPRPSPPKPAAEHILLCSVRHRHGAIVTKGCIYLHPQLLRQALKRHRGKATNAAH